MDVAHALSTIPFSELLGIEITDAADGRATGRLDLHEELYSVPGVAHGAVPYALADTVGVAAILSEGPDVAPTIDPRMDYLAPVTTDMRATGEVVRMGGSVAAVDVQVRDPEGEVLATARGVYKIAGDLRGSAWDAREGD